LIFQVIAVASLVLAAIGILLGAIALVLVVGLKNSTHKISILDPNTQSFSEFNTDTKEQILKNSSLNEII